MSNWLGFGKSDIQLLMKGNLKKKSVKTMLDIKIENLLTCLLAMKAITTPQKVLLYRKKRYNSTLYNEF